VEKAFVAQRVANKLFATENAVDAALAEATELMADMLRARQDLNLSATVGDAAVAKLIEAISAMGEARSAMVAAHSQLAETKLRVGIRTKLAGVEDKGGGWVAAPHETVSHRDAV
jgi:hypothetical protein